MHHVRCSLLAVYSLPGLGLQHHPGEVYQLRARIVVFSTTLTCGTTRTWRIALVPTPGELGYRPMGYRPMLALYHVRF
eukprot:3941930-Rhodomonas_salina.5